MAAANKLAVLQKIKQEESILFGSFLVDITKQVKCEKWAEVSELAESLGLVTGKPWQYVRDTLWCNWRKRTLAKRDDAKKTGTGGRKEAKFNEVDHLVLEILGKDNPAVEGLGNIDSLQCEGLDEQQVQSPVPATDAPSTSAGEGMRNARKSKRWIVSVSARHAALDADEENKKRKLHLQIEHLEIANYKMKLEALQIETKLSLPRSKYTQDFPDPGIQAAVTSNLVLISQDGRWYTMTALTMLVTMLRFKD